MQNIPFWYSLAPPLPEITAVNFSLLFSFCDLTPPPSPAQQLEEPTLALPEEAVWYVIKQVGTGLDRMHTNGLVHMDIKPENILISSDGVLKIGDLGMAQNVDSLEDGLEGDARYMAPELLQSSRKTRQLDLFSFGLMIWELAAGRPPPKEGAEWRAFRDGKATDPRAYHRRSAALCGLVRQLMDPVARKRPLAEAVLECPEVRKLSKKGRSFILKMINRSRQRDNTKRRKTSPDVGSGSGAFRHIGASAGGKEGGGVSGGGSLRIGIPSVQFDAQARLQAERSGMHTPTDQIVGHSYANTPTPSHLHTPSHGKK